MKFYGTIGFSYEKETAPGVWEQLSEEHQVYGDVLSDVRRWETGSEVNDDINVTNRISIVASQFVCDHFGAMRYVVWNGTAWKIKSVELVRPRAILTLGGVYSGK